MHFILWQLGFPALCWIRMVRVDTFFSDLRRKVFNLSSISRLAMGLSYMAFIMFSYIFSKPNLLGVFMIKKMLCFVKCFFLYLNEMIVWFFFYSINVISHLLICVLSHPVPRDKSHLIMMYDAFHVFLILVC